MPPQIGFAALKYAAVKWAYFCRASKTTVTLSIYLKLANHCVLCNSIDTDAPFMVWNHDPIVLPAPQQKVDLLLFPRVYAIWPALFGNSPLSNRERGD
jgi:hypothetical protein